MSKSKATTKKTPSSASTFRSLAAQLLVRRGRGGREASNGDSIDFFSDLQKRQPEPRVSGQTEGRGPGQPEDGRGMTRRRGSSAGSDELLSSEIAKHDYDWLLTPPGTPLRSPAASSSGHQVSTVARVETAKSDSRLGKTTGQGKENATSRLARSSSATVTQSWSSLNTPAKASSGGGNLSHVQTLSSASASSINTPRSNASVGSTPLVSTASSSPRTSAAARSAWSTAGPCRRRDNAPGKKQASGPVAARQPWASASPTSAPRQPAPTSTQRGHAWTSGVVSPRSTTSTSHEQVPRTQSKRASAVARSRLAGLQGSGTGSTVQASSSTKTASLNRDVQPTRGARALPPSSSSGGVSKTRAVPSASTTTQQRWRQTLAPAIAAARSARREDSAGSGSPRSCTAARKISADQSKATTQRAAAVRSALARTASRPKSANGNTPTKACRPQDHAKHGGGAPAHQKPTLQKWGSRSVSLRSPLGCTRTTSESSAGSISHGQSTPDESGLRVLAVRAVAAAKIVSRADAIPSSRYDAMLLREDPKNLTWLRGCNEGDEGLKLVDGSLEPFDAAAELS